MHCRVYKDATHYKHKKCSSWTRVCEKQVGTDRERLDVTHVDDMIKLVIMCLLYINNYNCCNGEAVMGFHA